VCDLCGADLEKRMTDILIAGPALEDGALERLRMRAIFEHFKWDTHSADHSVLARYPLLLDASALVELRDLAESLSAEALECEREIAGRPELWREMGIPRKIRRALTEFPSNFETSHVRVMRFDFHLTDEGWQISEVNADVPGGYVEAAGWNSLFAEEYGSAKEVPNPARKLAEAIQANVGCQDFVALVHATNYSDDRQVMVHLAKELREIGLHSVLVGPRNVVWKGGRVFLKSESGLLEMGAVIRFFPAEWLPETHSKNWEGWFSGSETVLCNPGTAILLQTKRFPLVWDRLGSRLSTWQKLLPITIGAEQIADFAETDWVIKPAFGRVGEDVGMQGVVNEAEICRLRREAKRKPREWVLQRRFRTLPVRVNNGNIYPCIGVFTVNGKFGGVYGRVSRTPLINQEAKDIAVLVAKNVPQGMQ
jgi:glutathionylspermidine synthase